MLPYTQKKKKKKKFKNLQDLWLHWNLNVNSNFLKYSVKHRLHPNMICSEYE